MFTLKGQDEKVARGPFYHTTKTSRAEYLTSYTNTLQLIGYQYFTQCKMLPIPLARNLHNLHTTYTPHMLPHDTSMRRGYYGIGEQESLLLRQIFLRPYGVTPTAYVQTDCKAAGCDV